MIPALPALPAAPLAAAADQLALLGRITLSLLVVLTIAVLGGRLARRVHLGAPDSPLHVRARTALNREASVAVVEIGGRALVLGVTSASVRLLTTLDAAELETEELPADPTVAEPGTGHRTVRRGALHRLLEDLRDRTVRR